MYSVVTAEETTLLSTLAPSLELASEDDCPSLDTCGCWEVCPEESVSTGELTSSLPSVTCPPEGSPVPAAPPATPELCVDEERGSKRVLDQSQSFFVSFIDERET